MLVFSCRKKDQSYAPINQGEINLNAEFGLKLGEAEMGSDYLYQSFFDLGLNEVVGQNEKLNWEIGLACDSNFVILNNAISGLRVARSPYDWDNTVTIEGLNFGFDFPEGQRDDYFIGAQLTDVYVLDLGLDVEGLPRGVRKFGIDPTDEGYLVTSSSLEGDDLVELNIETNDSHLYKYVHLQFGETEVAPAKNDWDIVFSHYLHIFDPETEPFPYQVTGCLINPNQVTVHESSELIFNEVDFQIAENLEYSNFLNVIGFDWKDYDFDLGFIVDETRVFVIQSTEGDFYKLQFTSFYNEIGVKGSPRFNFQKLRP
jgi:hypothetical protein